MVIVAIITLLLMANGACALYKHCNPRVIDKYIRKTQRAGVRFSPDVEIINKQEVGAPQAPRPFAADALTAHPLDVTPSVQYDEMSRVDKSLHESVKKMFPTIDSFTSPVVAPKVAFEVDFEGVAARNKHIARIGSMNSGFMNKIERDGYTERA